MQNNTCRMYFSFSIGRSSERLQSLLSKGAHQRLLRSFGKDISGNVIGTAHLILLAHPQVPQGFGDLGEIDPFRTPRSALVTGSAQPDGLAAQRVLLLPQLTEANDLAGDDIHFLCHGASGRALPALVTAQQILTAEVLNPLDKLTSHLFRGNNGSHIFLQRPKSSPEQKTKERKYNTIEVLNQRKKTCHNSCETVFIDHDWTHS
jgi:hypothetical protein